MRAIYWNGTINRTGGYRVQPFVDFGHAYKLGDRQKTYRFFNFYTNLAVIGCI